MTLVQDLFVFINATLRLRTMPCCFIFVRGNSYGERNMEVCPDKEQAGDEAAKLTLHQKLTARTGLYCCMRKSF